MTRRVSQCRAPNERELLVSTAGARVLIGTHAISRLTERRARGFFSFLRRKIAVHHPLPLMGQDHQHEQELTGHCG